MKDARMTEPSGDQSPYQTTEKAPVELIEEPAAASPLPTSPSPGSAGAAQFREAQSMSDSGSAAAVSGYQLPANPLALARLSFASAVMIASLVCLQDAVAILPGAINLTQWIIRVCGLWLSAYFLWAISFFGLCLLVGIIGGGIRVDSDGIRLWRFGKKVLWSDVRAVGLEEQPLFSAIFLLRPPAARITIYSVRKPKPVKEPKPGQKAAKPKSTKTQAQPTLVAMAIPSFSFARDDFNSLLAHISDRAFGFTPDSAKVNISKPEVRDDLREAAETGRFKRIAVSCLIASSLVFLLGRRALTNYYYNDAYRLMRLEKIEEARDTFAKATKVDPSYAIAWDRLARMENRLGDVAHAREHWQRALLLRPDLVDSKIGLAQIAIRQCQYATARALLISSIRLQPRYMNGYLTMADLELKTGNPNKAQQALQFVLQQEPSNHRAVLLLARAKMELGDLHGAQTLLSRKPPAPSPMDAQFESLVEAEYLIKAGRLNEAQQKIDALAGPLKNSYEVYLAAGLLSEAMGKKPTASVLFDEALKARPNEVWPVLYKARMAMKDKNTDEFNSLIAKATSRKIADPGAFAFAARMLTECGDRERARELVMSALELEPTNEAAQAALGIAMPADEK